MTPATRNIAFGLLFALGFGHVPDDYRDLTIGPVTPLSSLALLVLIAPFIPLIYGIILALRPTLSPWITGRVLALFALAFGMFVALIIAAFSGAGTGITLVRGGAISLAVFVSLWPTNRLVPLQVALSLLAIFSLSTMALVPFQAKRIAEGNPYQIIEHATVTPHVLSGPDLRFFSLYTAKSGFKDTSTHYFHAVLCVEKPNGETFYNWSPRRLRFDKISNPNRFIVPLKSTVPKITDSNN